MIHDQEILKKAQASKDRNHEEIIKADLELSKIYLYISGGAFAVSITFFINLGEISNSYINLVLILAWSMLGLSIISHTIGYHLCKIVFTYARNEANKMMLDQDRIYAQSDYIAFSNRIKNHIINKTTPILDIITIFAFILGIVLLTLFASIYLISTQSKNKENKNSTEYHCQKENDRTFCIKNKNL